VAAAAGFLILLALDSSDDLQRWGHYIPRANRVKRGAARAVSGQRIAAAAIIAAVVLPLFIPADSRNFVANLFHPDRGSSADSFGADTVTAGSGTGGIDPFAALRGQLKRDKKVDLLTVRLRSDDPDFGKRTGPQPFYLRTNVLPVFTGAGWRPGPEGSLQDLSDTQYASSPGTAFEPRVVRYSAEITVSGLRSNPPLFATPTALSGVDRATKWSPQNQLLVGSQVKGGQTIQEDVAQPQPTTADLNASTESDPAMQPWLKLPKVSAYVRNLTASVIAKATTPYQKARAISDYFANPANNFAYSLQTSNGDSGDDLTDFLQKKLGYCQQYAAAMGVMLRLAKVPARVVLGYAHEVPDATGSFTVTTYDAHAWVEAYFSGIGWVPFDPTPIIGISGGQPNDLAWAPHDKTKDTQPNLPPATTSPSSTARPGGLTQAPVAASSGGHNGSWGTAIAALILVAVVAAVLLAPAFVRWRRRRHRLHQARHGDTDALWGELSDTATDLGYVWSAARTPRQVATWLGGSSTRADTSLQALTAAVEQARYAPAGAAPSGAGLVHDLTAVEAGLRSRRSGRERLRAIFWPASLGWSHVPLIGPWLPGTGGRRR
jgi:transglutaminase-like putative cysteine protease